MQLNKESKHVCSAAAVPRISAERVGLVPGVDVNAVAARVHATGIDAATRGNALRPSPSYYNKESDVERLGDSRSVVLELS